MARDVRMHEVGFPPNMVHGAFILFVFLPILNIKITNKLSPPKRAPFGGSEAKR